MSLQEKYDLKKLLKEYKLIIPIIQRDYAHGRTDSKTDNIRQVLIDDISTCLNSEKSLDFNFVYGTLKDETFFPVDGQQRLTTLYLFHWYIAIMADEQSVIEDFINLKNFEYETRSSASEFFRQLKIAAENRKDNIDNTVVNILRSKPDELSKKLKNSTWYRYNWDNDPTVKAAIQMLSDIHSKLKNENNLTEMYNNLDKITFQFHTSGDNDNSDAEITAAKNYIRMNARGKPLDDFENLKAMLDKIENLISINFQFAFNFASNYDTTFIEQLYRKAEGNNLEEKTTHINERSLNIFLNIYNICCEVLDFNNKTKTNTNNDYIIEIYNHSRKEKLDDIEEKFFAIYIKAVNQMLDMYCKLENSKDETKKLFDDLFNPNIQNYTKYYSLVFTALHSNKTADKKQQQYILLDYVSNNIHLSDAKSIYSLAEKCADTDVYDYIINTQEDVIKETLNITTDDYCIKEQKIKATLLRAEKQDDYLFKELEGRNIDRSIRYLLYISGYWNNNGNFDNLNYYYKIAMQYFYVDDKNLEWPKLWAVSQFCDNDVNLLFATEIEEKCGEYKAWSNDFYNFKTEDELKAKADDLKRIMFVYQSLSELKGNIDTLTKKQEPCWLKFAVQCNLDYLINCRLEYDKNQKIATVVEGDKDKKLRYDMFLIKCQNNLLLGIHYPEYRHQNDILINDNNINRTITLYFIKKLKVKPANANEKNCLCTKISKTTSVNLPTNYYIYEFKQNYIYDQYTYDIGVAYDEMINNMDWSNERNFYDFNTNEAFDIYKAKNSYSFKKYGNKRQSFVYEQEYTSSLLVNLTEITM